ncbi:actin, plasmodial isoform-like [Argopecten irradians]|uniref:actin, plasmodial isoform-like n=1 Tax=Argopecten irradians TaxID=31199 RepID=UPI003714B210
MAGQGVVIDLGSWSVKAGVKGQYAPIYKCIRTETQQKAVLDGGKYPIEKGLVTNWEDFEQLLRNTFKELGVKPEEQPVLLTQSMTNTKVNKEKVVQMLFERFNVPSVFLGLTNVLSLYCTGKLNGVVMESGGDVSNCVSIYQGYAMLDSIVSTDVTGKQLTKYISQKLNKPGLDFEVVDDIKKTKTGLGPATGVKSYTLPDGSSVNVVTDVQRAPGILLDPSLANMDTKSIPQTIVDCIEKVRAKHGEDRAKELYGNIVISGGNTEFDGMADRVQSSIQSKMAGVNGIQVTKAATHSAWIGGSILASHENFDSLLLTKAQYDSEGTKAIEGKF